MDPLDDWENTHSDEADPVEPKQESKPLTREDLELLSRQQNACEEIAESLRDKALHLVSLCSDSQLPKGLRSSIRCFDLSLDTFVATKALIDYYLEINEDALFQTIGASKLKSMATNTFRTLQAHQPSLEENLKELEDKIGKGEDRLTLNLRTRIVKEQALTLCDNAKKQATAFSATIDSYSPDISPLALLKQFAQKNDSKVMVCIDHTLNLAETIMVRVEDAPKMLEALENNDIDTIVDLQKKLIDNLFENQ